MYGDNAFQNAHVYMSDITRCKNKYPIIHISRDALMFTTQAEYLEINSGCFEVSNDYGKWQDLSKFPHEDGPN